MDVMIRNSADAEKSRVAPCNTGNVHISNYPESRSANVTFKDESPFKHALYAHVNSVVDFKNFILNNL